MSILILSWYGTTVNKSKLTNFEGDAQSFTELVKTKKKPLILQKMPPGVSLTLEVIIFLILLGDNSWGKRQRNLNRPKNSVTQFDCNVCGIDDPQLLKYQS